MPPKGWVRARRVSSFQAPKGPLWRRFLGKVFNYWTLAGSLLVFLAVFLTLGYYWFEFSDRIDRRLLSGDVFTASAGIYSAPKTLRKGEAITQQGLLDYLKSAGYVDRNVKADHTRSRFSVTEAGLIIEPGITGTIDGQKVFPELVVKFAKDGKTVASITDQTAAAEIDNAQLEPRILSTIAAEGDGRRKTVAFADLPQGLVKAIIVTEDRAFFEHYGVNLRGIARALWSRYEGEENSALANQGGSSITQQLVKNLMLTRDPTWERKITEAYMSIILETRLSKEEIFTLYVNQIYLGQQAGVSIYGVGEAANIYFGKDVSQLTLAESAFIAGIVRSPNRYGPYKNPEKVTERRNQVLISMLEAGEITPAEYEAARNTPFELKQITSKQDLQGMPYFSQYVVDTLPSIVSDPDALQHLRVYTSIDPDLQRIAYETVVKRLERLDKYFPKQKPGNLNASLVAMRPKTGEIVAMVGGRDYLETQFNRATSAMRQPGSVFKPFVYAAAINSAYDTASRVFTAATVLKDEKKIFTSGRDSYAPNNFGDTFSNKETTLRDALVKSKNTIAVDVGMQVNIGRVMNLAHKAGMPKVETAYPSMALGTAEATPLNMATAYTTFANLGERVLPRPIVRVTAGDGTVKQQPGPDRKEVIRPDVAYIMNDIMKDIVNRGTAAQVQGWGLRNVAGKKAFAGKTGTSRDGWFAGFTPELVVVVYVGFDDNDDLGMKGSDSAMPIWADFMKAALDLHPEWNSDWQMPAGIRKAEIDIRNGSLIRELDGVETLPAANASPTPSPSPTYDPAIDDPDWAVEQDPEVPQIFVTDVPPEFRRIELFVAGTIPNRMLLTEEQMSASVPVDDARDGSVDQTWQDLSENSNSVSRSPAPNDDRPDRQSASAVIRVSVIVCKRSGLRVSARCPEHEARTFEEGKEPREFCAFHR